MKTFIVMTVLIAGCMAELAKPEAKIINPDMAFTAAWDNQNQLHKLQEDINEAVEDVVVALSGVLKSSSATALERFQGHVDDVLNLFAAPLADFNNLPDSDCKKRAKDILDQSLEFTGYDGSICAGDYNIAVDKRIEAAQKVLYDFDDLYSQVQMIVEKSFIGFNVFLQGEAIEAKIVSTVRAITNKWNAQKPQLEAIRANLAANIKAVYDNELVPCNQEILDFSTSAHLPIFARQVNTCKNLQTPAARSDRFGAQAASSSEAIYEEFLTLNAQWKAQRGHPL